MKKFKNLKLIFSVFISLLIIISNLNSPILVNGEDNFNYNIKKEVGIKNYADGEIIVKFKDDKVKLDTTSGKLKMATLAQDNSLEKKEDLKENNISVFKIKDNKTVEEKIAELESDPNVLYAEPNYKRYPSSISTNDTSKNLLWGLDNTSQTVNSVSGTLDADIDGPEAWAINEGTNSSVIVAVIDTGVGFNHPDILANMWDGTNCKDQLGNFLGGCNHGYDYESNDKIPLPLSNSHGTHVSGTIAALKNNSKGIIGVAPNAKIMAIKFGFTVNDEIKAINFAIKNGAKIINASFGGSSFSQSEYDAMNLFKQSGGIFVAAAGNDGLDNNTIPVYPSSYDLDNIISVAATDQNDSLATFSDYGTTSVDVGAPGTNILSLITDTDGSDEKYGYGNGTSMAAPHVAGLAALIWGMRPSLTYIQVKNIILSTGDSLPSLNTKTVSGKRINAFNALNYVLTNYITYPTATITYSDTDLIVKAGDSLTITANLNEPVLDSPSLKISISGSNILAPTLMTKVSNTQYTYIYTVKEGDGIANINLSNATNAEGNSIVSIPSSGSSFTVDNTAPTISISSPSALFTKSGPITYIATYTDATSITLADIDVTLNTTGGATGTINVSPNDETTRKISISNISGDGTLGISINTNTASDITGNISLSTSPSEIFTVDNTAPLNQDIVFSSSLNKKGSSLINIVSSENINNNVWIAPEGTNLFTESSTITKAINGTALSILAPESEGVYKIFIIDEAGNISAPSLSTLTIDNTAPLMPTITSIANDNKISYEEKNSIHITGIAEANSLVTISLTDNINTKVGTQQLINNNTNYDIEIIGSEAIPSALIDGTIYITATSTDEVGNISPINNLNVVQSPQIIVTNSGGGGGGGSSSYTTPTINPIITTAIPTPLISQTAIPGCDTMSLFSTITGKSCGNTNIAPIFNTDTNKETPVLYNITKTLKQGNNNNEVKVLQKYLNSKSYYISLSGPGSIGKETTLFGPATKKALIKFQKANKLKADGVAGAITRSLIK